MQLTSGEGRVVACLAEKQLTTPQQYPLTLNALVLACNQSSNREPVVDYDEATVSGALSSLKSVGLVRFVHPSHGRSVTRYEHLLHELLGLDQREVALLAVLVLRGPQTAGELRTRTDRMCSLDDIAQVERCLERLSERPDALVRRLARRPGQKEERWAQLLAGGDEPARPRAPEAAAHPVAAEGEYREAPGPEPRAETADVAQIRAEVGALRSEMADLRAVVADLSGRLASLYDELH